MIILVPSLTLSLSHSVCVSLCRYPNFDALLANIGKSAWNNDFPAPEEQKYFAAW